MQIKTSFAVLCSALALAVCAQSNVPSAASRGKEAPPLYRVNDNGTALLTQETLKTILASEIAVRRKLAYPGYFTDVQNDFADLLRQVYADPFEGRQVGIDKSMPDDVQKRVWAVWQAYEAYSRRSQMRKTMGQTLSFYQSSTLFRYTARVARAKYFYESDKMAKTLSDLKNFNAVFKQLDTTTRKDYAEGYRFGKKNQAEVTLAHLFGATTTFSDYVNEFGRPRADFWNRLKVLMLYNQRMCDAELKRMKFASRETGKTVAQSLETHHRAVAAGSFYEAGWAEVAALAELDEEILDRMTLALAELDGAIKKFEDTGSKVFELRSGLPCAWVFSKTGVATDRPDGPDYQELVLKAYFYLKDAFNKLSFERNDQTIPLK